MFFPLLILVGGFIAVHILTSPNVRGAVPLIRTGAVFETQARSSRPSLRRLLAILRHGEEPEPWMVDEAMSESYDLGDWKTVAKLHHRFYDEIEDGEEEDGEGEESDPESEPEQPNEGGEQEENQPPDHHVDSAEIVIGKNSPFEGIPNDAWDRFVSSLETQKPDYQGPKHVGRYHHSKERLAQLKIEDVSTPDKQYHALVKDLVDARDKARALITEFECSSIALATGEQAITLSGILAVIKSAGMEHARSWFVNPDDRKKFPKTTEMFSKANGAF